MRRLEAICQGQSTKKRKFACQKMTMEAPEWLTANIHTIIRTEQNSHFLDSNPLSLFFRVHTVDIWSIDEQHRTQKKTKKKKKEKMMKKVVRLCTSLHYVIDVCHIRTLSPSFIFPFIITTRKKRAYFMHKGKGFRYNVIVVYLTI